MKKFKGKNQRDKGQSDLRLAEKSGKRKFYTVLSLSSVPMLFSVSSLPFQKFALEMKQYSI